MILPSRSLTSGPLARHAEERPLGRSLPFRHPVDLPVLHSPLLEAEENPREAFAQCLARTDDLQEACPAALTELQPAFEVAPRRRRATDLFVVGDEEAADDLGVVEEGGEGLPPGWHGEERKIEDHDGQHVPLSEVEEES